MRIVITGHVLALNRSEDLRLFYQRRNENSKRKPHRMVSRVRRSTCGARCKRSYKGTRKSRPRRTMQPRHSRKTREIVWVSTLHNCLPWFSKIPAAAINNCLRELSVPESCSKAAHLLDEQQSAITVDFFFLIKRWYVAKHDNWQESIKLARAYKNFWDLKKNIELKI